MTTRAPAHPTTARLGLLGGFTCRLGDDEVRLAPTAERVVAYLAVARRRVRRHELAGTLWPRDPDRQGLTRLRTVLWKVPSPLRTALVRVDTGSVGLHPGTEVDLYAVDRGTDAPAVDLLTRGELLPGWSEDWVLVERARHRQLHLHALEDHSAACRREGRHGDALRFGLEAVAQEPLRESARRRVIEVHLAEGNAAEALGEYDAFRALLRAELGLSPSPALRDLVRPLLGRPADRAPQRTR